jgi:hypothetical protein
MTDISEEDCQNEKADEAGQVRNLNAIMQLLLQQYQDFVGRKERLENKPLGYLTPLSILLAASIAILIKMTQTEEKDCFSSFFVFFFIGQVFFSFLTFIFVLKAYSVKTSWYPNIKEHSKYWQMKEASFLGRINNAFLETNSKLNKLIKKLVEYVQCYGIFLTFSMVFGILNIVIFIMYILQYFMRG